MGIHFQFCEMKSSGDLLHDNVKTRILNCTLTNCQDGRFYVMCILPKFKKFLHIEGRLKYYTVLCYVQQYIHNVILLLKMVVLMMTTVKSLYSAIVLHSGLKIYYIKNAYGQFL